MSFTRRILSEIKKGGGSKNSFFEPFIPWVVSASVLNVSPIHICKSGGEENEVWRRDDRPRGRCIMSMRVLKVGNN